MFKGATKKTRVHVTAALAALWLTACGGGGGDGIVVDAPPPASGGGTPAPAPGPAPAPAPGPAPAPAPVGPLTWNTTTGSTATAMMWHWVSMNPTGTVMAAAAIPGTVHVSTDSGATWTATTLPTANWISVDMTDDGSRMVAIGFGGAMYMSIDSGATWTQIDTAFNPGNNIGYESVTISQTGDRIVAVDLDGNVYTSVNGTAAAPTFTVTDIVGAAFRAVDGSADGSVVVAASQNGDLHISTDAGVTFVPLPVVVNAAAVTDNWYRVAVSGDGNTIAVAGNTDFAGATSTGLYVSRDRGVTWTQGSAVAGTYTGIDTSANGDIIVASLSGAGQVLLSTNGGQSFTALTTPAGETNWRSLALTGNADRLLLAAGTFFATNGQMYLSSGSVTGQ